MAQELHLIATERAEGGVPDAEMPALPLRFLRVASGVSYLSCDPDSGPEMGPADHSRDMQEVFVEPIDFGRKAVLLLITPARSRAWVNGLPAPRVAVIRECDCVRLPGATHVLYLCLFNSSAVGPPPPDAVGRNCPVCRTPVKADTCVYCCSSCGRVYHMEDEAESESALQCAQLISRCECGREVLTEPGYGSLPEEIATMLNGEVDGA